MFDYSEKEQEIINDFDAFNEGIEPGGLRNKNDTYVRIVSIPLRYGTTFFTK